MCDVIPILISKDRGGQFVKAEEATIEKVDQDCANTLTCHEPSFSVHHCNMVIVAMRGRNPYNPSDRTPGIELEQRLEPNSEGICNTITTVQKDNLVLENIVIGGMQEHQSIKNDGTCTTLTSSMGTGGGYVPMVVEEETLKIKQATKQGYIECKVGGVADFSFLDSKSRRGRVQGGGDICPTLMAGNSEIVKIENDKKEKYRIRKLTPRECWRLMGFTDTDFEAAEKVNSNTQLYKQAGNSIVKNVIMAIFKQMIG